MRLGSEDEIEAHLEELMNAAKGDATLWRRLQAVPLYWMTHGELEQRFMLGELLRDAPAKVLRQCCYMQTDLPKPLEETTWDARQLKPDLQVLSAGAYVLFEIKGPAGSFRHDAGPLQYARGLCIGPPEGTKHLARGVIAVGPRKCFQASSVRRIWERWQIEFRRLTSKVPGFQWGIILSEDLP